MVGQMDGQFTGGYVYFPQCFLIIVSFNLSHRFSMKPFQRS